MNHPNVYCVYCVCNMYVSVCRYMCCVHSGDAMDRVIGMPHHTIFVVSCVCECVPSVF